MNTQHAASPNSQAPKLAAPGAGVPLWQRLAMRAYFGPWVADRANWDEMDRNFEKLGTKILELYARIDPAMRETRVLVKPLTGLEDSSRYWSAAMVLEHLMIVGHQVRSVVIALSRGQVPSGKADVALVKPKGALRTDEAQTAFERFIKETVPLLQKEVGNRDSATTFVHPWFGKFKARQWHWLMAQHSLVHYVQLKEIWKELGVSLD